MEDGWMDGWMMAREEDDGGRRERVKARLDDASRLFGRVSQIGPDFKSPTKHSSPIAKSKFLCTSAAAAHTQGLTQVLLTVFGPRGRNCALKQSSTCQHCPVQHW